MKSSVKRHVEAISVLQFVLTFLLMGISFTALLLYLMFTSFWIVSVLYFVWFFLDSGTPERGGRRSVWFRRWAMWRQFKDYFPIKMVKTAELSPDRNYIFGCHPHGIMCFGPFCNFCTEANNFLRTFPGIRPTLAILGGVFRLPVYRDYLMSVGMCPVSKVSLDYLLSQTGTGNAVMIVIGGAAESLQCAPGEHALTLRGRKGFVRLALEHGADLVPVYTFGESDLYQQVIFKDGSWMKALQLRFQKIVGFAPCCFIGRAVLSSASWGMIPFNKPVTTVVGRPIRVPHVLVPSCEEVDTYHQLYMEELRALFDAHKVSCSLPASQKLSIL
ncbi:2-acylglycerol O-acyltransferase 3 [Rhinatrema bivittatum]|uniref:2-acylglycerol O-acyltransferase 3 n=1 Tax=Rhinatrema bivittatum TaxID=194408 RepID=UPI001129494B|nr:2-acylglycerol O-acyltransferase 3 [Rhinatrema bivittatum]